MGKFIDISLMGDRKLQRKLKRLPIVVQRKIVRHALREAARPVLATAKALVPVDTGRLKKSLKIRSAGKRGQAGIVVRTGTRAELGIPEDAKYFYPAALEFGHGNVPAYPFLRPALDQNRPRALKIIARELGAGIEREAVKKR